MAAGWTWRDGERTIRFGAGALAETRALLSQHGFEGYALLTTDRAAEAAPELREGAAAIVNVPPGKVDQVSVGLLDDAGERPIVALGGGRVIDAAKAVAGVQDSRVAAVPTTLSGAPMTPFHRVPEGAEGAKWVRPALVVVEPALMASQPEAQRAASAMNALAHAMESLYAPGANPVAEMAALRAAELFGTALFEPAASPDDIALAGILGGYAVGLTGLAIHHALSQTLVRVCGSPHAETNAVMLPQSAKLMVNRAPEPLGKLAAALGDPESDPAAAPGLLARLAARSGHTRLGTIGVEEGCLGDVVEQVQQHPGLSSTPDPPDADELRALLQEAL